MLIRLDLNRYGAQAVVASTNTFDALEPGVKTPEPSYITRTDISIYNHDLYHSDSYTQEVVDTISIDSYGISMVAHRESAMAIANIFRPNALCATSCPINEILVEQITGIQIFSISTFDSTHTPEDPITDYFIAEEYGSQFSIDSLIKRSEGHWSLSAYVDFRITTTPTIDFLHQFVVNMELSDGRVLSDTTDQVFLVE